jgi:hypothetical protein
MNVNELREKFDNISYNSFICKENQDDLEISYFYQLGEYDFTHKINIPKKKFFNLNNLKEKDVFLFNLGLVELISYYKLACPKRVILRAGNLDEEQKEFWKKLFYKGLGEFRFVNNIDIPYEDFVTFENATKLQFRKSQQDKFFGNLLLIGGCKDSIVTIELLKVQKESNTCFIVNPRGATIDTVNVAGYSMEDTVEVLRKIDPLLIKLNGEGFLNGHVPFSASLAFLGIFCALLSEKEYVVLSNESSANEATDEETGANHQYSKSLEFELDFVKYVEKYINSHIKYFSLLRGMRELDIAKKFAEYKQYHKIFRSCNVGSKNGGNEWCGKCPKCLFVYIILAPFIEKDELIDIFGRDLLDDLELKKYFDELTGKEKTKPFECVGTREEVNEAISMIKEKYKDNLPALLK